MHYYPFHHKDYRAATAHLTNDQDLAYRRMLDLYYDLEQPLPDDVPWIAARMRVTEDVVRFVLADLFTLVNGNWHNQRADDELAKMHARTERNRENGRRGGRKPSGNPMATQSHPNGNPVGSQWQPTLGTGYMGNGSVGTEGEPEREKGKRSKSAVEKPDDVTQQTWDDWVAHRKSKRASVTAGVIATFRKQLPAGWTAEHGLAFWTMSGNQGFFPPKEGRTNGGKTFADRCVKPGDPEEDWPV